jgi:hypothetical protein
VLVEPFKVLAVTQRQTVMHRRLELLHSLLVVEPHLRKAVVKTHRLETVEVVEGTHISVAVGMPMVVVMETMVAVELVVAVVAAAVVLVELVAMHLVRL